MSPRCRFPFWLGLVCLVGFAAPQARAVLVAPAAPLPEGPVPRTYAESQARFLEAQTKARAAKGLAEAVALQAPGQDLYDVRHYDLALTLNPTNETLTGDVTVTAAVTGATLSAMVLDLKANMAVTACTAGGVPTTFSRNLDVLSVDLDRTYATGETVAVSIAYHGDPVGESFGWNRVNGQPLIWTLSEPYGARDWWPCKDLNTDKADSVDIRVTVPDNLIVASNGRLVSDVDTGSTRTAHWHVGYPICTYLVSLAIHPYAVFSHWYTPLAGGAPMEVRYYVLPSTLTTAQTAYAPTVDMITAFAQGFGEYPFLTEKYGHAHFPWGGGMEHQTLTSLYYNGWSPGLISHELSHQWWGDMVTCSDFQHIWLNEGFATWSEAYWRERSEGFAAYQAEMDAAVYFGGGTIFVEDPADFAAIFNYGLSYLKASWVVHMLRHVLGDDDFFAALRDYRAAYEYGSATTEQFRDLCETISGQDLDAFFQQWIYGEYYPVYEYDWWFAPVGDSTRVNVRVRQAQTNTGLFAMPLDLFVDTDQGTIVRVVANDQAEQVYCLSVPGVATQVQLDRDRWVLKSAYGTPVTATPPLAAARVARLEPNYPNPFNPLTRIPFDLPRAAVVRLAIYDAAGRLIRTLADGERPAGRQDIAWNGRDAAGRPVSSGAYFARLTVEGRSQIRPLLLAR